MPIGSLHEIVVDCSNPIALARFWQALIGGEVIEEADDWVVLDGDDDGFIHRLPEGARAQVGQEPAAPRRRRRRPGTQRKRSTRPSNSVPARSTRSSTTATTFQVMADPEGNEFCFITGDQKGSGTFWRGDCGHRCRLARRCLTPSGPRAG
ncbi:MAG: VOC family protein [Ilumatobacteraceae bacterium]